MSHRQPVSPAGLIVRQLPALPPRPDESVHFMMRCSGFIMSSYDAAEEVEYLWTQWAEEAESTLLQMAELLESIELSASDLTHIVFKTSGFEGKPELPPYGDLGVDPNEFPKTWKLKYLADRVYRRIHVDWNRWANQIDTVWEILAEKISLGAPKAAAPASPVACLANVSESIGVEVAPQKRPLTKKEQAARKEALLARTAVSTPSATDSLKVDKKMGGSGDNAVSRLDTMLSGLDIAALSIPGLFARAKPKAVVALDLRAVISRMMGQKDERLSALVNVDGASIDGAEVLEERVGTVDQLCKAMKEMSLGPYHRVDTGIGVGFGVDWHGKQILVQAAESTGVSKVDTDPGFD